MDRIREKKDDRWDKKFSHGQDDDAEWETATNLLYNVAEICFQDSIDIGQGMINIWDLTDRKKKQSKPGDISHG